MDISLPNLPGKSAHLRMAPEHRISSLSVESAPPEGAVESAVLVIMFPQKRDNPPKDPHNLPLMDWEVLLIERSKYNGVHSGEIAFPGGKREEWDKDFIDTACREASEEMAIKNKDLIIFGLLSRLYVPPSNHTIYPVLACACWGTELIPRELEVISYKKIPIRFFNPESAQTYTIETNRGESVRTPAFIYEDYMIWGATAMILAELYQVVLEARLITSFIKP
ncbi:MAG: CoA pyrophosphatase [Bacteroidales bacterium]|nr:CoA pyrophosphatase [Bacteroidales bacterium]